MLPSLKEGKEEKTLAQGFNLVTAAVIDAVGQALTRAGLDRPVRWLSLVELVDQSGKEYAEYLVSLSLGGNPFNPYRMKVGMYLNSAKDPENPFWEPVFAQGLAVPEPAVVCIFEFVDGKIVSMEGEFQPFRPF